MQAFPWWVVEERTHRLREVGMLERMFYIKLNPHQPTMTTGSPLFTKAMMPVLVTEAAAVLRSSAI